MKEIEIPMHCDDASLEPHYASTDAAGADIRADVEEDLIIHPGSSALISSGVRFEIPAGFEIQVRPRSGLALKHGITVLNTPGTIDADYRGVVKVILINHGHEPFTVSRGMRIAQIIVAPVVRGLFVHCEELNETARSAGGFGHTGSH